MASANKLHLLQQNLQNVLLQKQQLLEQLQEYDATVQELKKSETAYKILGKIMVSTDKDQLLRELQEKRESVEIRYRNYATQEERLQQNLAAAQKELIETAESKKK